MELFFDLKNCYLSFSFAQICSIFANFFSDINRAISPSTNSDLLRLQTGINVNSYGLVTGNQNEDMVDMEVQENVIGAVIGPGGRSIVELQQFSGARIQVSKKGAFSPGTR